MIHFSANEYKELETSTSGRSNAVILGSDGREGQMVLELPLSKLGNGDIGVLTLYELCLRFIYERLQRLNRNHRSIRNSIDDLSMLPKTIKNDLSQGPTAYCQNCECTLFRDAFIRIFDSVLNATEFESYHFVYERTKVILYFCSLFCSRLYNLNTMRERISRVSVNFLEVDWHTCEL